jgi:hypothetical protein
LQNQRKRNEFCCPRLSLAISCTDQILIERIEMGNVV